jgi:pentatricopeptide repeat protein
VNTALAAKGKVMTALRQGRLSDSIGFLQQWIDSSEQVPASVAPRFLMAAAKIPDFETSGMLLEMKILTGRIESRSLDAVVMEAMKNKDAMAVRQLYCISKHLSIPKSQRALEMFAKVYAADAPVLQALVMEADTPLAKNFAKVVLEACIAAKDVDLAAEVFEKVAESDAGALRGIVEKAATTINSPAFDNDNGTHSSIKEIRVRGKAGNLKGAVHVFEQQKRQGLSTALYNAIIDACVEADDHEQAVNYLTQAESNSLADAATFCAVMKGYLARGNEAAAKNLLAKMKSIGVPPTTSSFHGLLNARVSARDRHGAWKLVEEMQACGTSPNPVTCSILLKLKFHTNTDVNRVLALIAAMQEPMDAVLFSAIADTCIRTGQLDVLCQQTARFSFQEGSLALTAPVYGSLIKSCGQLHNVRSVWSLWNDMIHRSVLPTAVTLGCMIEALVSNGCTVDAWHLVGEMWRDEATQPFVNTVTYSTIIKGFAHAKDVDKVVSVYEEMKRHGLQPNNITYNTMLNAFAQSGAMQRVPLLLAEMKEANPPVEPDVVTYSTIIKGYCSIGSLDRALQILRGMMDDGRHAPDEVVYNSLLDGCAREQRPDEALWLLAEMKTSGVTPSNYTLSMLVKLMGRCRRLEKAFELVAHISHEYGVQVNIQVYTCLMQACFNNRQTSRAVNLHDQVIKEGLQPDEMTYTVLVQGCLKAGQVDKAMQLARSAYSLGSTPGVSNRCLSELSTTMGIDGPAFVAEITQCIAGKGKRTNHGKGSSKGGNATLRR